MQTKNSGRIQDRQTLSQLIFHNRNYRLSFLFLFSFSKHSCGLKIDQGRQPSVYVQGSKEIISLHTLNITRNQQDFFFFSSWDRIFIRSSCRFFLSLFPFFLSFSLYIIKISRVLTSIIMFIYIGITQSLNKTQFKKTQYQLFLHWRPTDFSLHPKKHKITSL